MDLLLSVFLALYILSIPAYFKLLQLNNRMEFAFPRQESIFYKITSFIIAFIPVINSLYVYFLFNDYIEHID
jgi:hypothetical protein